ncbi:MAG: Fe-S cluster assembly ATPase SufC [Blautia sp.]|nr:Fe-S cluster assembly ATPase SufC [Blautia sp.]MDY2897413.1 Fe-S cluster assembly ATPase SufC [Candidatus Limivivens sp.]
MSEPILKISQLTARVEEKEILHDINFEMRKGETHVLMGPNGAGKSTLGYVLMGNPKYEITEGSISFKGKDITAESADRRAKDGMFLSFQEPLEVAGLSVSNFIRSALQQKKGGYVRLWDFKKELKKNLEFLDLDESYAERSLNVGFSGGEKKKIETLQLMMLRPSLAILDETDSGLDVDAVRLVSRGVEEYQKDREGALLIITHSTRILESLHVDYTHVMVNGHIVATGDGSMVEEINEKGYENFLNRVPGGDD